MISLLFVACSSNSLDAPPYAEIEFQVPDDSGYEVLLSESEQLINNMGRVLPFSLMVKYGEDAPTCNGDNTSNAEGNPAMGIENVRVELLFQIAGLYIIPSHSRQVEEVPWEGVTAADWKVSVTVDGNFFPPEDWCLFTYVDDGAIITLPNYNHLARYHRDGDNDDVNDPEASSVQTPNYYIGTTDNRGVISGWLFIDYFEGSEGNLEPAQLPKRTQVLHMTY